MVAQAKAANIPLIPAVRDGMPARTMAAILADPAQRAAHVAALVNLVAVERLRRDRPRLRAVRLRRRHLLLGHHPAAVGAVRDRAGGRAPRPGQAAHRHHAADLQRHPGAGQRVLGLRLGRHRAPHRPAADHGLRVQLLAHPGPMAPHRVGRVRSSPTPSPSCRPAKVQIGVPAYGRNWVDGVTGTCPSGVSAGPRRRPQRQRGRARPGEGRQPRSATGRRAR